MKKLGLDIGSSSLGWTLRNDDNTFTSGVITFKSGMVKGTGGYSSPTKDRREARSKRKLIQARKYRKWELLEILLNEFVPLDKVELENWSKYKKGQVQNFPENPNFLKWLKCDFSYVGVATKYNNPYELRVNALDDTKKLHNHEIGRALYHLVQRRGYKDIGETDKETEKQKERRGTGGFQKALDNNRTIAEALQKEFLDKGLRARNQYPYRDEYEHELFEILKAQGYNISRNSKKKCQNEFVQKVRTAIIWQRPLRTQKGNIGKCTLEPTKPRCPVSHPVFEIFRTWGFINTIRYYDEDGKKKKLGKKEREILFEFFLKKEKNFKFEDIKTQLNKQLGKKTKFNYPINKEGIYDTSVSGMPVCKGLIEIFGESAKNALANIHQHNIGNAPKIINEYSIYDLWHILFAFDERTTKDKKFLEKFAIEKLNIQNDKTKKGEEYNPFAKIKGNITTGYADLSLKALCKIIPFLKDEYLYNEAVVLAKIPELLGESWKQNKDMIEALVHESSEKYNWDRTIVGITNNLIDQYKGLEPQETFAYKDFQYHLAESDFNEIKKSCIGSFGEKTWNEKTENERQQILDEVRTAYQEFFYDKKRTYRITPLLTNIFKEKLKEKNIEINGKLYHHSNIENKYLKRHTDPKTGAVKLPTHIDKDTGAITEILPQPLIDSIKNPMFNKAMSIVRKLINELIKIGKIDEDTEVVIEVARELNDNNKRAAIERYQREREGKREKYREFLNEFNQKGNRSINVEASIPTFELWTEQIFEEIEEENGKKINKNTSILKEKEAIKRYELWAEQKGLCMYTGKMISVTQLFSNEIDIEHTIPRSLLPDNTMTNQTVAYAWYNRDKKKNQLPTQCANYDTEVDNWGTSIKNRLEKWEETRDNWKRLYEDRLRPKGNEDENAKNKRVQEKHYFKMHYDYWNEKVERFTAEEVKDSWARRQLVDTQMVSKYAREFLKAYFRKVAVQKGGVTADFRKIYGFQDEDRIKDRNRHTHHAIDAAVLTLIPVNSSHRERILKEYYEALENFRTLSNRVPFAGFSSQALIQNIENNTLIVNYVNDKILKQTFKNVRNRGKLQYLKDKQGKFRLDENSNRILLKAKGDTVRSELYAQTYLGKIKDVERYDDGQPKRKGSDWEYKTGKDEFVFVKRESIDKVKASDKLIEAIVDPVIKDLVKEQKNKSEIKDPQGRNIRHVRVRTSAGKEVKERVNYISKHDYKNKFYSESGSLPYAVLLQNNNNERVMIPVASFELAKAYKKYGSFVIDEYLKKYDKENNTKYADYPDKKLLKVGQKVIVLKEDAEYDKRKGIDFQINRLYRITQFESNGKRIMLQYHLEAQDKTKIDTHIKLIKDSIVKKYEMELGIPLIKENDSIVDNVERKKELIKRIENFPSRLKFIAEKSSKESSDRIKEEIEKYQTEASSINGEEIPPLLKMSKSNWNFLYEGEDFEISLLGEMKWVEERTQNKPGNIAPVKKKSFNEVKVQENVLSEPVVAYDKSSGALKTFNSFEEAAEADAKAKAAMPPEQHIANVTKRIRETYADELKKPMDKNLKFRND